MALQNYDEYAKQRVESLKSSLSNDQNAKLLQLQQRLEQARSAYGQQRTGVMNQYNQSFGRMGEERTNKLQDFKGQEDTTSTNSILGQQRMQEYFASKGYGEGLERDTIARLINQGQSGMRAVGAERNAYDTAYNARLSELEANRANAIGGIEENQALAELQSAQDEAGIRSAYEQQFSALPSQVEQEYMKMIEAAREEARANAGLTGTYVDPVTGEQSPTLEYLRYQHSLKSQKSGGGPRSNTSVYDPNTAYAAAYDDIFGSDNPEAAYKTAISQLEKMGPEGRMVANQLTKDMDSWRTQEQKKRIDTQLNMAGHDVFLGRSPSYYVGR
jgi:vacuolar-type H+-ATPase subunit I/STV1